MTAALIRRSLLPALLCGAALAPLAAEAGEITTTPGTHFDCAATFSGRIEPGDLDKIRQLTPARFRDGRHLCLNSEGGSFDEAIRIADDIHDRGIPTAVDDGATCLGSCAYAFLGGSRRGFGTDPTPDKSLHLNGTLGFGAPAMETGMAGDQAESVYKAALRTASEITARLDTFEMPADFAARVLALQDSDILYVQRVDQARALGLRLEGFEAPGSLGDTMVLRACIRENADFDPDVATPGRDVYDHRILRETGATAHRKATYVVEAIIDGVPSWIGCQVELAEGAGGALRLRASDDWTAGGNPPLRQVQQSLIPQTWDDIPFRDFWKLIPADQTLAEARNMTAPDASSSTLVAAVGLLPATTPGTEALLDLRFDDREEIQNRLTLLGFDTNGADGIFGPGTRAALRAWQDARGYEPTGFLDATQRDALYRESESQYLSFAEEERQREAEERALRQAPAVNLNPPAAAPEQEPQGQRVRVCQRTLSGELVNCRIEFR